MIDGYEFRILTSQGDDANGGSMSYVVNGKLTRGFAVIASPVKYGDSGVMTFLVSQEGVVYQKDLGDKTAEVAPRSLAMTRETDGRGLSSLPPDVTLGVVRRFFDAKSRQSVGEKNIKKTHRLDPRSANVNRECLRKKVSLRIAVVCLHRADIGLAAGRQQPTRWSGSGTSSLVINAGRCDLHGQPKDRLSAGAASGRDMAGYTDSRGIR